MNSKQLLLLFKLIFPAFCVGLLLFVSLFSGNLTIDYFDISADSSGNVYIGELSQIRVVDSSKNTIRKIKTQTLNGYRFTIKDDILYLSTGSYVKAQDLEGNELNLGNNNNIPSESFIDQEHFTASDSTTLQTATQYNTALLFSPTTKKQGGRPVYLPPCLFHSEYVPVYFPVYYLEVAFFALRRKMNRNSTAMIRPHG